MSRPSLRIRLALARSGSTGCPNGSRRSKPERLLPRAAPLVWLLSGVAWACGARSEPPPTVDAPPIPAPEAANEPAELRFAVGDALSVGAGTATTLVVVADPPGVYPLQLSVDAIGAFLDKASLSTAPEGTAEISLRLAAEAEAEPFEVEVRSGTVSARLQVTPTFGNTATLNITTSYAGTRTSDFWFASIRPGERCASLPQVPPDGDLRVRVTPGAPVRIENVPINRRLAVVVRAEQMLGGCADVPPLRPNSEQSVPVTALDRPLELSKLLLNLDLGIETTDPLLEASERWIDRQLEGLNLTPEETAGALLDAMGSLGAENGVDAEAFASERSAAGWDTALAESVFAPEPAEEGVPVDPVLVAATRRWMRAATLALAEVGGLRARVEAIALGEEPQTATARLTIQSAGGLAPSRTGLAMSAQGLLSADPGDNVRLGVNIPWNFARYLREGARLAAEQEMSQEAPAFVPRYLSEAWAHLLSCDAVAALVTGAVEPSAAFANCDGQCAAALCEQGLEELWQNFGRTRDLTVDWEWSASGKAQIDEKAHPTRVTDGSWTGKMVTPTGETDVDQLLGSFVASPVGK